MQIFFIKKKSTSDHDADDHNGKPPPPHTLCGGEVSLRRLQEMGREWEGIGRGIRSRPPNIPPYPPHTMCVGGRGDSEYSSEALFF